MLISRLTFPAKMNILDKIRAKLFDQSHNVDTYTKVQLTNLEVVGSNKKHGRMYFPTLPKSMRAVIDRLDDLDPSTTTFIDVGCGKGLALLVASRYPFKKIIGVEFSKELCKIAQRNIGDYRGSRRSINVEIDCIDAADFKFPSGNLLIYFFNPFDAVVMESVLRNLAEAARSSKGKITVICDRLHDKEMLTRYLNPQKQDVFLGFSIYSLINS
jgi:SAM-dependent methyltransferase